MAVSIDYAKRIDQLEEAAASGALTIESDGERITYRSMSDLMAAIDYFRSRQVEAAQPSGARPGTTLAVFGAD